MACRCLKTAFRQSQSSLSCSYLNPQSGVFHFSSIHNRLPTIQMPAKPQTCVSDTDCTNVNSCILYSPVFAFPSDNGVAF